MGEDMYSWRLVIDRVSEGALKDLYIVEASNPDERVFMKLELARIILDNLEVRIEEDNTLEIELSKEEKENYRDLYNLYMVGKLLKVTPEAGAWKYLFTIGGLQLVLSIPIKLEQLNEMDKVYIGVRVSR
ncbi:MAG: hypothetical protein DRJ49_02915 [Thermoprotei archaeon]|nr:MAG: hypothetical protein DRJ49_02915 [Thermoprotei archaeon]